MTEQVTPESWHIPRALSDEGLRLLTSLPMDEIERRLRMEPTAVEGQPSDEKLLCIAAEAIDGYGSGIKPGEYESFTESAVEAYGSELCAFARAVLARWSSQQPQRPIPVSERLPGPEDCIPHPRTKRGNWCWGFERVALLARPARWRLMHVEMVELEASHWLPANALPLPEAKP